MRNFASYIIYRPIVSQICNELILFNKCFASSILLSCPPVSCPPLFCSLCPVLPYCVLSSYVLPSCALPTCVLLSSVLSSSVLLSVSCRPSVLPSFVRSALLCPICGPASCLMQFACNRADTLQYSMYICFNII
jgi:hypothetical protein